MARNKRENPHTEQHIAALKQALIIDLQQSIQADPNISSELKLAMLSELNKKILSWNPEEKRLIESQSRQSSSPDKFYGSSYLEELTMSTASSTTSASSPHSEHRTLEHHDAHKPESKEKIILTSPSVGRGRSPSSANKTIYSSADKLKETSSSTKIISSGVSRGPSPREKEIVDEEKGVESQESPKLVPSHRKLTNSRGTGRTESELSPSRHASSPRTVSNSTAKKDSLKESDPQESTISTTSTATPETSATGRGRSPSTAQRILHVAIDLIKKDNSSSKLVISEGEQAKKSPKRKKVQTDSEFFNSISVEKELIEIYLKKAAHALNKKDGKTDVSRDDSNPHLHLLIVPDRDMKKKMDLPTKTAILINKNEVLGKGANSTVVKGYDLINRTYFAAKIFRLANSKSLQEEIYNLTVRGWFFGCYKLQDGEFAIVMKNIPGNTFLPYLYRTDEALASDQDNINVNYCTEKNELSFIEKLDSIIKSMQQVSKAHNKYKLLHRDLKPTNFKRYFENGVWKVRLIDWGDAIPIDSKVVGICGTDGYIHPDIWNEENPQPYGIYAELFALAVFIGEILSDKKEKHFQKGIREEQKKALDDLESIDMLPPASKISREKIIEILDDVFKWEELKIWVDSFESVAEVIKNLEEFLLLQLKKLDKKMLMSQLEGFSLEETIKDLLTMKANYELFCTAVSQMLASGPNLENNLKPINQAYGGSFFKPETKARLGVAQQEYLKEATDSFKEACLRL